METYTIRSGLHLYPEKLKAELQDMINRISPEADRIILGFGLCSMAAIGLRSDKSMLIIPRIDDCINLFLGSSDTYKHQHKNEPGTYYLSKGWIDAGVTLNEEFRETEERLGKRAAKAVKNRMLKNYTRLAYIDMGYESQSRYRDYSKNAAKELGLRYEEIKGTTRLLEKMLNGPWDEEFIIAPPGYSIELKDFKRNSI
jgi:hypothetical protein